MKPKLTHIDASGQAIMVDVGGKAVTRREAVAQGAIKMARQTMAMILSGKSRKGDVLGVARIAGIMAAKKTAELIPLCHPLALTSVEVEIEADPQLPGFQVRATARVTGQTGVEIEAMTAVSIACLTLYDMAKAADRGMQIVSIRLVAKSGGKSANWQAECQADAH